MDNDVDIYNRRRKQSFPDEEESCFNDEKPISDSIHKRKTRTVPGFHTDDRIRRKISSSTEAPFIGTETKSGSDQLLWWDECNGPDYPEVEFKKAFRMSKSTFELICSELNAFIPDEKDVTVKQRVAVCIFRLAVGEPFRLVSKRFGLSIPRCRESVIEVCSAIRTVLMPKYLRWPDANSLRKTKQEFETISWIPNVVGSMHTTHIPAAPPPTPSAAAYFNRKQTEKNGKTSYTITVQGVVDHNGIFTDVCIGWPGSMNDDQVLQKSALHERANGGCLNGVWVVGSKGYPLMDWVLVPYNRRGLTWAQHVFNEKISEIQRVVGACCVLHNICEKRGDGIECECGSEFVVDDEDDELPGEVDLRSVSSMDARDAIAHNLLHHACY
ncbi:putative WRKY transcription factor 50-like [Hibiscus syriacus]|uniref:WRKY transcription factor 50-like n=1 Tax=Hibiscus syriacus TaxID=106335 RepID=A0A6A2ZR37_HIBSY|nr:putative WRKY transcription factor 50-like [Hibiscus syriacus]